MTLSPAFTFVTPAPTSFTTPASSLPGENGRGGLNWYLFWMMRTSGKLTLAALTATTTSPAPARGEGNSSNVSVSGGPYCLQRTAFIAIECHMPKLTADDGVQLYYEETGAGVPVVFVHEFGGDHRSWEPQVRHFSRRYRCVAYNARGYPPSDVPEDFERYSRSARCAQDRQGARRRPVDGRVRHAAFRHGVWESRAFDHGRGRGLRLAPGAVPAVPGGVEEE